MFLSALVRRWRLVRRTGRVVWLCRFTFATLALVGIAFALVPQGLDLLRFVDESLAGAWSPAAWLVAALWLWALSAWYFSRFLLAVLLQPRSGFAGGATLVPWSDAWLVRWVPRAAGGLCFLPLAVGFVRVGAFALAGVVASGAALFLAIAVKAGDWLRRKSALPPAEDSGRGVAALPRAARRLALAFAALAAAFFVAFVLSPVRLPQTLGAAAIVLLAASTWIPFGTFLVYLGHRARLPVASALALLVVLFGFWNDNHALRRAGPLPAVPAKSLRDDLAAWVTARAAGQAAAGPIPVVLVVAEGGGARAATWTAHVLASLEEASPGFSQHVYAISAVSGGAVGAAAFAALMAESGVWPLPLSPSACHPGGPLGLVAAARCLTGHDPLSPALAGLLYPDLVARFSPLAIPAFDRSRAFERAWEQAWDAELEPAGASAPPASHRFAQPLAALWNGPQAPRVPNLILNGTWVESGERAIVTNLRLDPWPFVGAVDVLLELGADVPLATAAHAAARFPVVSPAGRVDRDGSPVGHVVDGGYFENAGATAALEVLDAVTWLRDLHSLPLRVVVIAISNDPAADEPDAPGASRHCGDPPPRLPPALRGLGSRAPLSTVLNARAARGQYALRALEAATLADRDRGHDTWFLRFGLRSVGPEPLGWQLSETARRTIVDQLGDPAAPFCNAQGVRDLAELLAPAPPPMPVPPTLEPPSP